MKRKIKLNKKFVSLFLAVTMIWSMGFTGVKASASTISYYSDSNNGDGSFERIILTDTGEAQLMVRVGDIDNFGFGWPSDFNPFLGNDTPSHGYPFVPTSNDIQYSDGTDRIMVTSGYINNNGYYFNGSLSTYNNTYKSDYYFNQNTKAYTSTKINLETTDGYTKQTRTNGDKYVYSNSQNNKYYYSYNGNSIYTNEKIAQADNAVRPITISFASDLQSNNISVLNATLQLFVDDFQAGPTQADSKAANHISQVTYKATINGTEIPELSNLINQLNQSGPIGKLITFQIPERYLDLVRTGSISIKIDDSTTTNYSDGYAIDFAKLLINKKTFANTGTVTGKVTDQATGNPISGAKVSAGGVVEASTIADGTYTLTNVPAGLAVITASKSGYNSQSYTKTIVGGGGYTQNFSLTPSTPPAAPTITATPTTTTNTKVTATITYSSDSAIKQYRINAGGTTGEWKVYTGSFDVTQNCTIEAQGINQYENESEIARYVVSNIDKEAPILTLNQSSADGTITATATDNIAVASITKPDNTVAAGNSTTYVVSADGTYTFKATDTAGNITTRSIIVNNLTQVPIINATYNSYTPNPAKSSDEITVKYDINTEPFALSSGMIDEAVVLVDMSQGINSNQRFSQLQNGLVNQVINDSNLNSIKMGVVGYNDSVYIGNRSNYNDPKSCIMQQTDENLSNVDKTNFLPLYNLNDGNTKDGYRQFYQNGYIYNKISSNDTRQFGIALNVADKMLTQYGTVNAKKAIVIISSGNLTYSDDEIKNIRSKGYKIITLDISNSNSANIKDTHIKLCGNESSSLDSYYKGTFNDGANYNSVDNDMKNVALSLEGKTGSSTLSVKDAKLNIDLGENFEAVDAGGLEGSGKIRTVIIPQINFTKNSKGLWEQSAPIEVTFKVKPVSGKYGQLGFGLYTNSDNSTHINNSTISYTNFNSVLINKTIETPTITINNIDTEPPTLTLIPSTTNPTSGTIVITAAASDNVAVASITTPDENIIQFNPATQNNSTTYIVSANGIYTFKATDTAGNVTTKSIEITNINRTGLSNQSIINSINTKRIAPNQVQLGETFDVNYTINFNNQTLDDSKPNRQQWLACIKDNSTNMNFQMVNDVQASSGTSRESVQNGINFKLNKNNIKCNESYYFSNDSSSSSESLSSRMDDALAAVTQKNSQGHERDIVIMIGTNISDSELQRAIVTANNIKVQSDNYKLGINSIVINIGNKTGEENIKKLAGALGGNYVFLNSADEANKINDNYISQLTANIADNYPLKNIYFEDTYSDNFEAVNAPSFITIDNTNKKINGSFYANYYIQDGQIKCDAVNFTVSYRAVSYKDSSYIGAGVFNVVNNATDQKILERVPIQVVVPDTTPPTIILTPSTTEQTRNNVIVTANVTDNVGVAVTKWARGDQTEEYFASNGTVLNGSTFIVGENGTYTVYAKDAAGNESVENIMISNIDKIPPTITLTPSTTALTNNNIIVTTNVTDNVAVAITKWASGNQTADYFDSNGTVLSGSTFTARENETYTVYAKDTAGNTNIETITIDNIRNLEANLSLRKELNGNVFVGNKFEIRYTIKPNDIVLADPNDSNAQELLVSNLKFKEYLPSGLALDQLQIDPSKLNVTFDGNVLSGDIVPTIRYTLDSTKTKYTAQPITFSIWVSSNSMNTYDMSGQNSYINYLDVNNVTKKANFNDLQIIVSGYSEILNHGIFNGDITKIKEGQGISITNSIPVTLAMVVDVKAQNPTINLSADNSKILESSITFKKYEILNDETIDKNSVQELSRNVNGGNINLNDLTMQSGKKYIIIYTITPTGSGNLTMNANVLGTNNSKSAYLTIKDLPDLY